MSPPTTIEEAIAMVGRKRDRYWLSRTLEHLGKGMPVDEALDDATRACFPSVRKEEAVRARSLTQIRKPEICQAIEDAFAVCGFTLQDAIKMHVAHIKGTLTKKMIVGGEVVDLPMPPSFVALQAYHKMTQAPQTAKVQIEHSNVNELLKTIDADTQESAVMRTVGEVIDVEPEEDPDDRDPFEDEDEGEDDTQ